jgi:hypothetical protein
VDPGSPAAVGGLRRGDVLLKVDGVDLITDEGGRRFGAVRPGQSMRIRLRRGEEEKTISVRAMTRPDADLELDRMMRKMRSDLEKIREDGNMERMQSKLKEVQRTLARVNPEIWKNTQKRLRYSGVVGSSSVVVHGKGTVQVSKDDETGELVITTSDAVIRVTPGESAEKR